MSKFTVTFDVDLKLGNEENEAKVEAAVDDFVGRVYEVVEDGLPEARNVYVEETVF